MNIVLIGFMGSGKTAVGRELASVLKREFLDTDDLIEQETALSINEIFLRYGEKEFRKLEKSIVHRASGRADVVIATGGGAVLDPQNVSALKKNGILVYLSLSPEEVVQRLNNDDSRPLLNKEDKENAVVSLLEKRIPIYESVADLVFDTEGKSIKELAGNIFHELQNMKAIDLHSSGLSG